MSEFGGMIDPTMLELFRAEIETHTGVLSDGLLALDADPQSSPDIKGLMRAAHSIKGAARILGLEKMVGLAHAMEDSFIAAGDGALVLDADRIDVLLKGVDLLAGIAQIEPADMTDWLDDQTQSLEHLERELSRRQTDAPAPESVPMVSETPVQEAAEAAPRPALEETPPPVEPETTTPVPADEKIETSTTVAPGVIRVDASSLNRLLGLAGESLVDSRRLEPFAAALMRLKHAQGELALELNQLHEGLEGTQLSQENETRLQAVMTRAGACRQLLTERLEELEDFSRRSAQLSDRLYREVVASRMRPFADGIRGFPRLVRDVARQLGKRAQLEVSGQSTPVDRDVLDKLEAPLTHIIRNALDHGLESPQERVAAGKPEGGTISLEARHRAGMLSITIADDGRGINLEAVRQKVVERGLADPAMAGRLSETELIDFLLLPGFSTADQVSDISGRGVGLDAVQSALQQIGGSLQISSRVGVGTQFHLQSPLTLSVVRTLLARIADRPFAFPLTRVDRVMRLSRDQIHSVEDRQHFMLGDKSIGLVTARQLLAMDAAPQAEEEVSVIVLSDRLNRYGLAVDRILGERELVVRPLDPRLGKVPNVSAAALSEEGEPMLVADVEDMVRSIDHLVADGRLDKLERETAVHQTRDAKRILVVDDSITVREVERKLLENRGYTVDVAVDGVDGWNAVRTRRYDLVVSDVDMPRMSGIEFVKQIRQDAQLRGLPVLIVSYKDREEDRLLGMEAGANYYLTKSSFADETLLQAVEDLIGAA